MWGLYRDYIVSVCLQGLYCDYVCVYGGGGVYIDLYRICGYLYRNYIVSVKVSLGDYIVTILGSI